MTEYTQTPNDATNDDTNHPLMSEAARKIDELRRERDEARQEVNDLRAQISSFALPANVVGFFGVDELATMAAHALREEGE